MSVWPHLETHQENSWKHVEREDTTGHAQMFSTGRWAPCYRYLHLVFLSFVHPLHFYWFTQFFCLFVIECEVKHMLAQSTPPPTPQSLFPTHMHTHIEGEHQQLVFSLCFSKRAALILPDKGWESQENISTHTHPCRNVQHHYESHTAHSYTSVLVAFYLNRLCHRFQCSLV